MTCPEDHFDGHCGAGPHIKEASCLFSKWYPSLEEINRQGKEFDMYSAAQPAYLPTCHVNQSLTGLMWGNSAVTLPSTSRAPLLSKHFCRMLRIRPHLRRTTLGHTLIFISSSLSETYPQWSRPTVGVILDLLRNSKIYYQ